MKFQAIVGLLAVEVAFASPITTSCADFEITERDVSSPPDLCDGAVNCIMVFHNRTQTWGVDFKENMGPGSQWFAENVEAYDEWSDNYVPSNNTLSKRAGKITSNLDRSSHKIRWGDAKPYFVLDNGIKEHCYQTSCDADWSHEVHYSDGGDVDGGPPKGVLKFNAIGTYPGKKGYYADAIGDIARKLHHSYDQPYYDCIPTPGAPPYCTKKTIRQAHTGRYFSITRFLHTNGKKAINGYVHVKVVFQELKNPDACQHIISGLSAIIGAGGSIAGIGSGFFGALGSALCHG